MTNDKDCYALLNLNNVLLTWF